MRLALLVICLLFASLGNVFAQGSIADSNRAFPVDLIPLQRSLTVDKSEVGVEVPGPLPGKSVILLLKAKGKGPQYFWSLYSFENKNNTSRQIILQIDHQGFVSSQLFPVRPSGSRIVQTITNNEAAILTPVPAIGHDAFELTLPPKSQITIGVQGVAGSPTAKLLLRPAYAVSVANFSFLRGALIGIVLVLSIGMLALYALRKNVNTIAGGLFTFASLAFIALEAGFMSLIVARLPIGLLPLDQLRAIIEGLMASGAFFCMVAMSDIRRHMPEIGTPAIGLAALSLSIPAYGLIDASMAISIARCLFAAVVAIGFLLIYIARRRSDVVGDREMYLWSALVLWTFGAVVVCLMQEDVSPASTMLVAGLAAVLIGLGLVLTHTVFGQSYLWRKFFADSGRRSLALAGARQHVWDWQPMSHQLHVAEDLSRALGYPAERNITGLDAFLDAIHPADLAIYLSQTDTTEARGQNFVSSEFRLRRADGIYRWFELRATIVSGGIDKVSRCIGTLADITETKKTEERLLASSVNDIVTGLPNRALFMDRLERALKAGADQPVQVLLVELENFKNLNEALGREVGDNLLLATGRRIVACVGPADTVARLSGDQFAVLQFTKSATKKAGVLAKNIAAAIAESIELPRQEVFLSANIGISPASEAGSRAEQLLKEAAIALYETKRVGERKVGHFANHMRDERQAEIVLAAELRRVADRGELEVQYQPISRLDTMELAGFEALVRWRHPRLGLLSPDSFIALAEQTGTIPEIGRFVLFEAARQLGIWQRINRAGQPVFMAVNVSAGQLVDVGLCEDVAMALERESIVPETFKIEITESVVMQYPERCAVVLERLRALGIALACDDFGTGHSSLSSLRDLPFDTLKIDRSFITADREDPRAADILEAIVDLAHKLDMVVVAEGIEDQEQLDRLTALDCDYGQGFLIGQPMTAKQVSEALGGPVAKTNSIARAFGFGRETWEPSPPPPTRAAVTAFAPLVPVAVAKPELEPEELPSIFGEIEISAFRAGNDDQPSEDREDDEKSA